MTEGRIYRVVNKVFDTHFWTKEDADKFLNSTPLTSGFRIEEITIFGKRPDWCPLKDPAIVNDEPEKEI